MNDVQWSLARRPPPAPAGAWGDGEDYSSVQVARRRGGGRSWGDGEDRCSARRLRSPGAETTDAPAGLSLAQAAETAQQEAVREKCTVEIVGPPSGPRARESSGAVPTTAARLVAVSHAAHGARCCTAAALPSFSVLAKDGVLRLQVRGPQPAGGPPQEDRALSPSAAAPGSPAVYSVTSVRGSAHLGGGAAVLVHGLSAVVLVASLEWRRVETTVTEEGSVEKSTHVSPVELFGGGEASWTAWANCRALWLDFAEDHRLHAFLADVHRCGVRIWFLPRLELCSGQGCCVCGFLQKAGTAVLPGAAAFGLPAQCSAAAQGMLALLPLAACSAAALLGGALGDRLQRLAPPEAAAAVDHLSAWLRSSSVLQPEGALLAEVGKAAAGADAGAAVPANRRLILTLTPAGGHLQYTTAELANSRAVRLCLTLLRELFPEHSECPKQLLVQVEFRSSDGKHPNTCGPAALAPVHGALFEHRIELGGAPLVVLHWSQSQMKQGKAFAVLLPGRSLQEAEDFARRVRLGPYDEAALSALPVTKASARQSLQFTADGGCSLGYLAYTVGADIAHTLGGARHSYTDGAGRIDADTLSERWAQMYRSRLVDSPDAPPVIQVRAGGCKGTLQSTPGLQRSCGVQVVFTKGMEKVAVPGDRLEVFVVDWGKANPLWMNTQALLVLVARGVPREALLRCAAEHARGQLRAAYADVESAWQLLLRDAPLLRPEDSKLTPSELCSIDPRTHPGLRGILAHALRRGLRDVGDRARFPLREGAALMMQPDFTGTLMPNEVYIRLRADDGSFQTVTGRVCAMKMPALHPRDLRMYMAVKNERLERQGIFNAICYSTHPGALPAALTQSGSDYDGDEGFVFWGPPELLPPADGPGAMDTLGNIAPYDYAAVDERGRRAAEQGPRRPAELHLRTCSDSTLSVGSTQHRAHADRDPNGAAAEQLHTSCAMAVDAPKTGMEVDIPAELIMPDGHQPRYQQRDAARREQQEQMPPRTPLECVHELSRAFDIHDIGSTGDDSESPAAPLQEAPLQEAPLQEAVALLEMIPPGVRSDLERAVEPVARAALHEACVVSRLHCIRSAAELVTALLQTADGGKRGGLRTVLQAADAVRALGQHTRARLADAAAAAASGASLPAGVGPGELAACAFHLAVLSIVAARERGTQLLPVAWIPLGQLGRAAAALGDTAPSPPPPQLATQAAEAAAQGERRLAQLLYEDCIDPSEEVSVAAADGACRLEPDEVLSIRRSLARHAVTIIEAPTGRGKSTLVPQLLLQVGCFRGLPRVVVSQRCRVACQALATRVAEDLGERVGERVGFKVGGVQEMSRKTQLAYMTEAIVCDALLAGEHFTHVVIDEVHHQSLSLHVLLGTVRRLLRISPCFKVVLMSATADTERLREYMGELCGPEAGIAPSVSVLRLAKAHMPCEVHYIDRLLSEEHSELRKALEWLWREAGMGGPPEVRSSLYETCIALSRKIQNATRHRVHGDGKQEDGARRVEAWLGGRGRGDVLSYLVAAAIRDVFYSQAVPSSAPVVVFLPGRKDLHDVREWLYILLGGDERQPRGADSDPRCALASPGGDRGWDDAASPPAEWHDWRDWSGPRIFLCEGRLPLEEQQKALAEAASCGACIVLTTNILEQSVTFPTKGRDPVVVDTMVEKTKNDGVLSARLVSRSHAAQRKGRTGRRGKGLVFRLCTWEAYETLEEHPPSSCERLDTVLLRVLDRSTIGVRTLSQAKHFLRQLLSAPTEEEIQANVDGLLAARAVERDEEGAVRRTLVGEFLRRCSMEPQVALLVVECCRYGDCGVLGCLAAAVLRQRGGLCFTPASPSEAARRLMFQRALAQGGSDLLPDMAVLGAFVALRESGASQEQLREWAQSHHASPDALHDAAGTFDDLIAGLTAVGLDGAINTQQLDDALTVLPVECPPWPIPPWTAEDLAVLCMAITFAFPQQCFVGSRGERVERRLPRAKAVHRELKLKTRGSREAAAVRGELEAHLRPFWESTGLPRGQFGGRPQWRDIVYVCDSVNTMVLMWQYLDAVPPRWVSSINLGQRRWLQSLNEEAKVCDVSTYSHQFPCDEEGSGRELLLVSGDVLHMPGCSLAMTLTRVPLRREAVQHGFQGECMAVFRAFEAEESAALRAADGETARAMRALRSRIQRARQQAASDLLRQFPPADAPPE